MNNSDSDTSDEDYVPEDGNVQLPSEEDSDGEVEDSLPESEQLGKRGHKRKKTNSQFKKKKRSSLSAEKTNEEVSENKEVAVEQKKKGDALWADFMKDTGFKTRAERQKEQPKEETSSVPPNSLNSKQKVEPDKSQSYAKNSTDKVKVTQIFEFAGEEVRVEKEVPVDSAEARLSTLASSSQCSAQNKPGRKAGLSGIGSVLSQLGKKSKISTLEKTKLDWEKFKQEENITEELHAYSKSKDGYLERQDFLERADLRRFEIEKGIRNTLRNNRMNNVNL